MTVLGVDETRGGKAHHEIDQTAAAATWVGRFDTRQVDVGVDGGLFAQVSAASTNGTNRKRQKRYFCTRGIADVRSGPQRS